MKVILSIISISKFLVKVSRANVTFLEELERKSTIYVVDFDRDAAQELTKIEHDALAEASGKRAGSEEPIQKIKVDRQIVAIRLANGARQSCRVTNAYAAKRQSWASKPSAFKAWSRPRARSS